MKEIRIIVSTPRPVQRSRVAKALAAHPMLKVIAQASDMSETYTLSEKLEPDIVILAEEYTRQPEFECLQSAFAALNSAWLMMSAAEDGARRSDQSGRMFDPQLPTAEAFARLETVIASRGKLRPKMQSPERRELSRTRSDRIVLIGASTGGVDALLTVLASFPTDCPPTAIVQHTGRGFSDSLISLLDRRCAARVVAAKDGAALQPGTICVAAGSAGHLRLAGSGPLRAQVTPGEPVSGHVPSVDELFRSALPFAGRVVAALLTGMGRDGAEGLLALRRQGAATIGQDAASAVVYGMPRAAFEIGAVQTQLPITRIGPEILRQCQAEPNLVGR